MSDTGMLCTLLCFTLETPPVHSPHAINLSLIRFVLQAPDPLPVPDDDTRVCAAAKDATPLQKPLMEPSNLSEVQSKSRKLTVTSFRFLHSAKLSTLQYNRISSFKLLIFSFRPTQGCRFISV